MENTEPIGSPDILTDGIWAWPGDLPYYVKHYNVRLPCEFIAHAKTNDWKVPNTVDITSLQM